jgi:hypothetical protein
MSIRKKMEETNSHEQAWEQIRRAALSTLQHDRETAAMLPDGPFSTTDAQRILGYARRENAYNRLSELADSGLIVKLPRKSGGVFGVAMWRRAVEQ